DGSQSVTRYVYDQRGRLLQTVDARGEATTEPSDYVTTYTYDGLGRLLTTNQWIAAGVSRTRITNYDDANRRITTTLANGLATTEIYDRAGWRISVSQADSTQALGTTNYLYDDGGRLRVIVDPLGNTTDYLYDEAGRRVATIDATGALTEFIYDSAGNTIRTIRYATAVNANARAALRDANGRPINTVSLNSVRPASSSADRTSFQLYDNANRLVMAISPHDSDPSRGYVTQSFYDGAGRPTDTIAYANAISLTGLSQNPSPSDISARLQTDSATDRHTRRFYERDGNLVGTLDAEGYLCEYRYNSAGQLVHTIHYANPAAASLRTNGTFGELLASVAPHANDRQSYHFYDAKGQTIATLDPEGYLTEYNYDAAGNRTQEIRYANRANPYSGTQTITQLRPATNANDRVTLTQWNGANQITQVTTNPSGTITRYRYDSVGNLLQTDKAWNTAEVRTAQARYDSRGNVLQELSGEGSRALENLLTQNPAATQAQIDALWNQWSLTHTYDQAGRRTSTTDPNGQRTLFYYDGMGRLTHTVNHLGEVEARIYNRFGEVEDHIRYSNRLSTTGLSGGPITQDLLNRLAQIARPTGDNADARTRTNYTLRGAIREAINGFGSGLDSTIRYTHNAFGEVDRKETQLTTTLYRPDTYRYDRRGLLIQSTEDLDGLNRITSRTYDAFGRLIQTTDAKGNLHTLTYDRLGREIATTLDPSGLNIATTTTYDAWGRTLTHTDARGNRTSYSYDDTNRSFTLTTPEGIRTITRTNRHGETVEIEVQEGAQRLTLTRYVYDRN
ncbi:MAG TPA: hypothetical protein VNP04_31850, partial [Alphaproteobacteria bacterium]|nr:hypothetical protein [Alphaproteobacteria bacterium]